MTHSDNPMIFVVGILGNIASFFCFIAPISIFYRIVKKKATDGFQSVPYVAALFSAMLWIFYAYIKTGEMLIITINLFGCAIETIYLAIYMIYCPRKARIFTVKLICLLNLGGICLVVVLTHVLAKERTARIELLGWICVVLSTSVFAAPLSIIRVVIRTKSVEFMPFTLSLLLTISAILWLTYGILLKDIFVTLPNFVGITFGTIQMVLYAIYRNNKPVNDEKLPEHKEDNNNNDNQLQVIVIPTQNMVDVELGDTNNNNNNNKEEKQQEKKQEQVEPREGNIELQQQKEG
ncbi:bidirectional sugar transporter N3 [Trifolium repens]|nr:bidirectional sugar transporter N3 [Trifolium repens]